MTVHTDVTDPVVYVKSTVDGGEVAMPKHPDATAVYPVVTVTLNDFVAPCATVTPLLGFTVPPLPLTDTVTG